MASFLDVQEALKLLRTPVLVSAGSTLIFANDAAREWLSPIPTQGEISDNPAFAALKPGVTKARTQNTTCVLREIHIGPHIATVICSALDDDHVLVECAPLDWHFETRALEQVADRQTLRSRFLKGLAHELRNPLAGMLGAAQLTAKKVPEKDRAGLIMIERECKRMDRLIKDMLLSARPDKTQQEDPHALLERCIAVIQHEFSVHIKRRYDPSIPAIPMDRDSLQQGLLNLLRNAAQSDASTITITTRVEHGKRLDAQNTQTAVAITIDDDGCGVPDSLADTLFFPLVSNKPTGTGLGLAQVQSVVTAHGGLVEYTPRSTGSRFTVYLPLHASS